GFAEGAGQLAISSDQPLLAGSRTWTDAANGTFGQFIPAVAGSEGTKLGGAPLIAIGAESSQRFRSNLGVAEISGHEVTVRMVVRDASGAVVLEREQTLGVNGFAQLNLAQEGAAVLRSGTAELSVIAGEGVVTGYLSIVDNRTGDPTFVQARSAE
ncbi:MAG: hypothetical protein WBX15_09250, partial [Thermoanaerobaculia bacterium]